MIITLILYKHIYQILLEHVFEHGCSCDEKERPLTEEVRAPREKDKLESKQAAKRAKLVIKA